MPTPMITDDLLHELVQREIAKDDEQKRLQPTTTGGPSTLAKSVFGSGAAADAATTLYGLTRGYREANPLYNFAGPKAAVPIALGVDVAAYLLGKKFLGDSHPKILNALLAAGGVSHGIAAVQNLKLLHDDPAGK